MEHLGWPAAYAACCCNNELTNADFWPTSHTGLLPIKPPAGLLQHARVAALEKQNRDLSWQVAMLARPGADKPHPPRASAAAPGTLPLHRQVWVVKGAAG